MSGELAALPGQLQVYTSRYLTYYVNIIGIKRHFCHCQDRGEAYICRVNNILCQKYRLKPLKSEANLSFGVGCFILGV